MDPEEDKFCPEEIAAYMTSLVKLDTLERITQTLNEDLVDSQRAIDEIQNLFKNIPTVQKNIMISSVVRQAHGSQFLNDPMPELLLPDMMVGEMGEDEIECVITSMQQYAEELKRSYVVAQIQARGPKREIKTAALHQYAFALDVLCKRLTKLKLSMPEDKQKNPELESKLSKLHQEVKNFDKLIETRTTVSEINKSWTIPQNNTMHYDHILNRVLSGINEVAYLIQNKK